MCECARPWDDPVWHYNIICIFEEIYKKYNLEQFLLIFDYLKNLKVSEEEIRNRAIDGLVTKSIIQREQIVSVYSITLPYGYPIPSIQARRILYIVIFGY
jgi:hypothetical protein